MQARRGERESVYPPGSPQERNSVHFLASPPNRESVYIPIGGRQRDNCRADLGKSKDRPKVGRPDRTEPRPSVPKNGPDRSRSNFGPVRVKPSVLDRRAKSEGGKCKDESKREKTY